MFEVFRNKQRPRFRGEFYNGYDCLPPQAELREGYLPLLGLEEINLLPQAELTVRLANAEVLTLVVKGTLEAEASQKHPVSLKRSQLLRAWTGKEHNLILRNRSTRRARCLTLGLDCPDPDPTLDPSVSHPIFKDSSSALIHLASGKSSLEQPEIEEEQSKSGGKEPGKGEVPKPQEEETKESEILSLPIDASLFLMRLRHNEALTYETMTDRKSLLFVLSGTIRAGDQRLLPGDSALIINETLIEISSSARSSVLLLELPHERMLIEDDLEMGFQEPLQR